MRIGRHKWELIYGYGSDGITGWNWRKRFDHLPQIEEIKETIIEQVNRNTDEKILKGLIWKDLSIWLSSENQFNYKAAYDLAVQTQGQSLPVTFKLGTDDEPNYYEFNTLDDLQDFFVATINHIQNAISEGWIEKDTIDWNVFLTVV